MDGQAVVVMTLLCLVWSLQQVGIKAAAHDMAPVLQIALRSGLAAMLVVLLMLARRENLGPARAAWRPGLLAGSLFALEYVLLGAGLQYTSAAHAVVFLYTGPLYQLTAGCVLLLGAAALLGQLDFAATPLVIGNRVFQSVIVSFASLLAWFHLLRRYLASRLGIFSFLTPLFGVLLGAMLLDEHVSMAFLLGAALVLAGIVLVSASGPLTLLFAARQKQGRVEP